MSKRAKIKTKFLSVILAAWMLVSALPFAGLTAFAETSGDFEYTVLEDGTAKITGYNGNEAELTIPSELDGYTVTSLGWIWSAAVEHNTSLTDVAIPASVTNIDYNTFSCCFYLKNITVDANNKNYSSQDGVLFNKDKTELIRCPGNKEGNTYIIPDTVTSIGNFAFIWSLNFTELTIPTSVTSIGNGAFANCEKLASITIPNSVTSFGSSELLFGMFQLCSNLKDIYFTGSEEEWNKFSFTDTNINNATVHFNYVDESDTPDEPTEEISNEPTTDNAATEAPTETPSTGEVETPTEEAEEGKAPSSHAVDPVIIIVIAGAAVIVVAGSAIVFIKKKRIK